VFLSNLLAIVRKEFQSYFYSPLAYVVAALFWFIAGFFFVLILYGPEGIITQVRIIEQTGEEPPKLDVVYIFLNNFFGVLSSLVLFILPIISMGLYAEERKRGTLELLATSPLTNWLIALGKLLGALGFFIAIIIPIILYQAIAFSSASPPVSIGVPFLAHLALILMAASVLSLGMFVSSLTDNTIISAILTFCLVLFLWLIDVFSKNISGTLGEFLGHFSLIKHYNILVQGTFDISSLVLFGTYIFLGLFLTAQSIELLRYQRN
jgi:ABC-2 type transport system permease protein